MTGITVHLHRAPRSVLFRKLSRNIRWVLLRRFSRWIAREPEIIVRVPPIDDALASAIKLISPPMAGLPPDEGFRRYWERDQNCSCWAEDAALAPLLTVMPSPRRILEIGPGLGRSAVFFSRRYFPKADFDLFDATGQDTKYALLGERNNKSFCGNLAILRRCLEFNEVYNYRIIDASATDGHLVTAARKYDFIYSFWAIGFHWSLDHWLDEILAVSHDNTLCVFTVPNHYQPSQRVASLPHVLLEASSRLLPNPGGTAYFLIFTPKPTSWLPL
jgi:hypothetical protein